MRYDRFLSNDIQCININVYPVTLAVIATDPIPLYSAAEVLEKNQHKIRLEKDLEPKEVFLAPRLGDWG